MSLFKRIAFFVSTSHATRSAKRCATMSTRVVATTIAVTCAMHCARVAADDSIGNATAITTSVTGTTNDALVAIASGDAVFHDEAINTDGNGIGQFELRDQTRLAVGPNSTVTLDDFVYDSSTSASRVVIGLTTGTLRFITGKSDHDAYRIVTPTATIGVRGTVFDLATSASGEVAVAMIDGAIDVCPNGRACFRHTAIGTFLYMTRDGIVSLHDRWDDALFDGLTLSTAMPFLTDQNRLLPALRGEATTVSRYLSEAGNVIKKPLRQLPKLKLPKLFK